MNIIIKAFRDNVLMHPYCPDDRPEHELTDSAQSNLDQNDEEFGKFYTSKEITPRDEIPNFGIKKNV